MKSFVFSNVASASRNPQGGSLDPATTGAFSENDGGVSSTAGVTVMAAPSVMDQGQQVRGVGSFSNGSTGGSNWVLGGNAAVRRIAKSIERAAEVECTVLVSGETGTGKELWARLLHRSGPRKDKIFVPVNCAALTPSLAESQLFGHEKGAFTGAQGRSLGIFRAAQGGVIFLDEIGEMPAELQPKLLRVLQQREVLPVGATQPVPIDVQIVAATNRNLEFEVEKGTFREDLYYRLNMIELRVPSLRDRMEDIPEFINFFARQFSKKYRLPLWQPTDEVLDQFCRFDWPGNVRQLSHVIEQAYVLQIEPQLPLRSGSLKEATGSSGLPCLDLTKLRQQAIKQALVVTRGHKAQAAKLLGVHANTLTRLIREDITDE